MSLKNNQLNTGKILKRESEEDIMLDISYVRESCALIAEALKNGCDIIQLANGDIITIELKPITIQYVWDSEKGKLIRGPHTHKPPKVIPRKSRALKSTEASNKSLVKMIEFA